MKLAIYGNLFNSNANNQLEDFFNELKKYSFQLYIYKPFYDKITKELNLDNLNLDFFNDYSDFDKNTDLLISIGGDGTFLDTLKFTRNHNIPVMGINTGRLGFLASIGKEEIKSAIYCIANNKFKIEKRSLIEIESPSHLFGDLNFGLNEVTIQKNDATLITIHTYVNDEFLTSYWGDGLIISTPTGSTAYSMSVGGPIALPTVNNFILSPIAPHNLNVRPILIPDNAVLRFEILARQNNCILSLDREQVITGTKEKITVKKSGFELNIILFEENPFFATLRNKLMWGADARN